MFLINILIQISFKIWSVFKAFLMRTTNSCEMVHTHFNSMFYTAYSNSYPILEVLKNFQIYTFRKMKLLKEEYAFY